MRVIDLTNMRTGHTEPYFWEKGQRVTDPHRHVIWHDGTRENWQRVQWDIEWEECRKRVNWRYG